MSKQYEKAFFIDGPAGLTSLRNRAFVPGTFMPPYMLIMPT